MKMLFNACLVFVAITLLGTNVLFASNATTPPVVNSPIAAGATSVSGTSTEPDSTIIEVFVNSVSADTTLVISGAWTKTGLTALQVADTVKATATASGLGVSAFSNEVIVIATLVSFRVEAEAGGAILHQRQGTAFNIKITALDGLGATYTGFTGTVNITSTGTLSTGSGATANFVAGVLASHGVTISNAGVFTLTATKATTLETGTTAPFTVSRIYYVSTSGNDVTGDGTIATPFLTIGKGVTTASSGDTVIALAGTYVEAVNVTKSLTLLGAGALTTTIEAPTDFATSGAYNYALTNFTTERAILHIGTSSAINVIVRGFTIDGKSRGPALAELVAYSGILADECTVSITQNTVKNMLPVDEGSVNDPDRKRNGRGIHIRGNGSVAVIDTNALSEINRYYILVNASDDPEALPATFPYAEVKGNTLTGKGPYAGGQKGIWFNTGSWGSIVGNTLADFDYNDATLVPERASGIIVRFGYLNAAHHRLISGNTLTTSTNTNNKGLYLQGIGDSVVNNTITGYRWGIEVHDAPSTKLYRNTITGGRVGVLLASELAPGSPDTIVIGGSTANKNVITGQDVATGGFAIALSFRDILDPVECTSSVPVDARYNDFGVYTAAGVAARIFDRADTNLVGIDTVLASPFMVPKLRVAVKAYLQGPYLVAADSMSGALNTGGVLASHFAGQIPPTAVDSITIEIRDSTSAGTSTRVHTMPAWLTTNGSIRGFADTTKSYVEMADSISGDFYIVVRHRNHLAIMTAAAVACDGNTTPVAYDFTTAQAKAYTSGGDGMKDLTGGHFGMFSADANASGDITILDRAAWRTQNSYSGYLSADFNLSGDVTILDRALWRANNSFSSQVP
jgi:hypothetical protein